MSNDNQEQISALLRKKATATPDEARRIRRQLRALGYKLSEVGKDPNAPTTERKATKKRREPSVSDLLDQVPQGGRRGKNAPTPVMTEDEVTKIRERFDALGLAAKASAAFKDEEFGYGFDLFGGMTAEALMAKFVERWPQVTAEWYSILGEPGAVRILVIGPVPGKVGA